MILQGALLLVITLYRETDMHRSLIKEGLNKSKANKGRLSVRGLFLTNIPF